MDRMEQHGTPVVEFWTTRRVLQVTGLSRSGLYRRIEDGSFPEPRKYRGSDTNYWPHTEVVAWQRAEIGADEFDQLLVA